MRTSTSERTPRISAHPSGARVPSVKRPLRDRTGGPDAPASPGSSASLHHDFSRISVNAGTPPIIQTKLKVNAPGDAFEQEADRIAENVTRMPDAGAQRARTTAAGPGVQTKSVDAAASTGGTAPPVVHDALRSSGQPLPASARDGMERRFGHDFSRVRVHAGSEGAEAADAIGAKAFTVGNHIVFGENRFAPDTLSGRRLLAHELTHVIQQGAGSPATGVVQRDPDTEKEVKRVVSPNVTMREAALTEVEGQLAKRMKKRRDEITGLLDELGPNPKSKGGKEKVAALKKDLAKDLATIIAEPDSKSVNPDLRKDITKSATSVDAQKLKLKGARDQWGRFDPIFAGKDVATALGGQSLTAPELKALVAQESGDLTEDDREGDIAGIAQLGTKEEKRAGGKSGDRLKPEKAIVLAAKILSLYAADLDKSLAVKPTGLDRKKFIMAAYNAGVNAVIVAQQKAIEMKLDGKTWASLIKGETNSALYKALIDTYKDKEVPGKFKETTEYIQNIFARLPP